MPLLDIAISQPCLCFGNSILAFRSGARSHNNIITGNDRKLGLASTFSWETFKLDKNNKLGRVVMLQSRLMIKAVATLDISTVACNSEAVKGHENVFRIDIDSVRSKPPVFEPQSSSEDSTEVGEREQLRRMRISKANKGNTPWNKGRKHSAETLQRIKERTRLAMQDPKVKMKLVNLGHAQSEDTKMKIGVGVRLGWERRREKLMLQETCYYEWQNLVAFAARKGILGEEELQWDSYKIIDEQLEKEWLHSVEQRKKMPRSKGSKRAPKSAEQRRKISAAIAAKWADPEYRGRVCTGLAKFHGITEGAERKPTRKPRNDVQTQKNQKRKDEAENFGSRESKTQSPRKGGSKSPLYKDPLASSKLEMLLNIRAKRAAMLNKQTEAVTRARLLIYEAEKAADALETAAQNSPLAQASLKESRMLISEAIQFIESIENEGFVSFENGDFAEIKDGGENQIQAHNHGKLNGFHSISSASGLKDEDLGFELVKENSYSGLLKTEEGQQMTTTRSHSLELGVVKDQSFSKMIPNGNTQKVFANGLEFKPVGYEAPGSLLKKWVRGRLVDVQG